MNTRNRPVAVITGANRGLGRETARQLGQAGYTVIITARDAAKAEAAAAQLRAEAVAAVAHPLDVTREEDGAALAEFIRETYGVLDALVNSAGVLLDSKDSTFKSFPSVFDVPLEILRQSFETNSLGPLQVARSLAPLLREGGRIVNVSSDMGQLAEMNGGWPGYRMSKTALNAVTRMLAEELAPRKIKVNSVCPGWVRTDMGGPNAERTVAEGAATIVWLAQLPADGPSGFFFRDKKKIPW